MDTLEKKFDKGIGKLDERIGTMKSEVDKKIEEKFKELKQLILGRGPTQTETSKPPIKPNVYVLPPHLNEIARRTYDDIGLELHNSNAGSSTTIGKNLRPKHWDVEGSNKLDPGTTNDMNGERLKPRTSSLFVEGLQPTGFRREFGVDPQAAVDREMQHMMGTNQKGEREHRGAGTNQAGDGFAYHGFEHRMRKLKIPVFEGKDAYGGIYRVEWYFEIQGLPQQEQLRAAALCMEGEALSWYKWSEGRTPIRSWDGFKRRLLILSAIRVMNPEGLNNVMELAVSIKHNHLYEGVMQSKGVVAIEKYTPSHRCLSGTLQVMLVDESDEAEEPDLNFKSWDRGSKID
ncbi:hypothetical protein Tco_0060842 [Tanacetum coccineum]